jgi:hypothetical protein
MSFIDRGPCLEQDLAWEITEAALQMLELTTRSAIFVMLGTGDSRGVIADVLNAFITQQRTPPPDLVDRTAAWLDCCIGADKEPHLRLLLHRASEPRDG